MVTFFAVRLSRDIGEKAGHQIRFFLRWGGMGLRRYMNQRRRRAAKLVSVSAG